MATYAIQHTSAFRNALQAVLPHTSSDMTLPVLCAVRFEARDGNLILVATDRYTLGVCKVDAGNLVNTDTFEALVSVADCKRILSTFKATRRDDPTIYVTLTDGALSITSGATAIGVQQVDAQFPAWQRLVTLHDGQADNQATYNPSYLARFEKAATGRDSMVVHTPKAGKSSALVTVGDYFVGVIMAQRQFEPSGLPAWLDSSPALSVAV